MTSTRESEFIRGRATWVSYILIGYSCFMIASLGPLMPYLRAEQNLNYTISSLHFSAWALGIMTAGIVGVLFIRRLGCSRAIWTFGGTLGLAALILIAAKLPVLTICSAFLGGLSGSSMGQAIVGILSERYGQQQQRSLMLTEVNIAGSLFAMVAPVVLGQCVKWQLGWRTALLLPIAMYLVLLFANRSIFSQYGFVTRAFEPGKLPAKYWFYFAVIWLSVASEWSIIFWASEFLFKTKDLLKEDATQAVSVFLTSMLIGRVMGLKLMKMFDLNRILCSTAALCLVGFALFWLGHNSFVSLIGLFVSGLGNANIYPLTYAQAIGCAADRAGLAAARMSISTGSAVLITPLILGYIADRSGISAAYGTVAVLLTVVTIMLFISALTPEKRASEPVQPDNS